jgi:16S rRNA (guanine966-N2)-methyltransferase
MRIVGGVWRGRRIAAPAGRDTRPTSDRLREAWMSAIADLIPDALVLDLFAGSGALGLETLSRGARHVTFVENAPSALRALERNVESLGAIRETVRIVRTDALRYVERLARLSVDLALADPPYRQGHADRLSRIYERTPFARLLCIEHARDEPVAATGIVRQRAYGDTVLTFFSSDDEL